MADETLALTQPNVVSRQDATGRDTEQYTVSVSEAAELFTLSGLPRTERAIQRFCKKGDLICAFQETAYGSRYLIKRSSVDRLIQQKLQALAATPESASRDVSRQDATGRDTSRHGNDIPDFDEVPESRVTLENPVPDSHDSKERHSTTSHDTLQKLREENLELKIDNAARSQFINHLTAALEKSAKEVQELSYNLGVAHTRVAQLEAPQPAPKAHGTLPDDTSRPVATAGEAPAVVSDEQGREVIDVQPMPTPAAPEQAKRAGWKRIFG